MIPLLQMIPNCTANDPRGPFLEGPEKFSHPESRSKISNLMITELFYSHIPGFIQEVSGVYTSPFSETDELKMALLARNVSGAGRIDRSRYTADKQVSRMCI